MLLPHHFKILFLAGMAICDPACGTGGFLLAAHAYISNHYQLDVEQKRHLKFNALKGTV